MAKMAESAGRLISTSQFARVMSSSAPMKQLTLPSGFLRTLQSTGDEQEAAWPMIPTFTSIPPLVQGPRIPTSRNFTTGLA